MGQVTFNIPANPLRATGAEPRVILTETGVAADTGKWDIDVNAGVFAIRSRTDADGAGVNVLTINRGATTAIADVTLAAGQAAGDTLSLTGTQVSITGSGGGIDAVYIQATAATGFISIAALGAGAHVSIDTTLFQLNTTGIEAYGDDVLFATNGGTSLIMGVSDVSLTAAGADGDIDLNVAGTGTINCNGQIIQASAQLARSSVAYTNNAAAAAATITNGPTAGNPTKWIPINDNGTIRNIPAW